MPTCPSSPKCRPWPSGSHLFASGRALEKVELLGFSSLKTFAPPVEELYGQELRSVTRRAKYLVWTFSGGPRIVLHLSQAGRVDIEFPAKTTRPRGSVARFVFSGVGVPTIAQRGRSWSASTGRSARRRGGCWPPGDDGPLDGLGARAGLAAFAELIRTSTSSRRLHTDLRDQRVVAGIGRGWGDDILHRARLSPFASLGSLDAEERERLLAATTSVLAEALALERTRTGWAVGGQAGRAFRRAREVRPAVSDPGCPDDLRRVSFESYEMTYCATCQTGGKVLADRRLSRLLK